MTTIKALITGIRTSNQSLRMVALLYCINLALAAILALTLRSIISSTVGDSMALHNLIKDFDYTVYSDFMFKHGARVGALTSQVTWLILFSMLVNTLLGGGIISTVASPDRRFSMRSFFEGCGNYFLRFLGLLVIFGLILVLVGALLIAILGAIHSGLTSSSVSEVIPITLGLVLILVFLFVMMLIVMMADYAKIAMVVNDIRSVFKASWTGMKFVFRNFFKAVGLQLVIVILGILAIVLYLFLANWIGMATPITVFLTFIIQQVSVGFKSWTRVLTFASETTFFAGVEASRPVLAEVSAAPTQEPAPAEPVESVAIPAPSAPVRKKRAPRRVPTKKPVATRKRIPKKK
jgi:hypothetical protein